jgi:sodium/potassium-transporting ATPase subunit alpha
MGDASESALVKFCHPLRDIEKFRSSLPQVAAIPFNSVNKSVRVSQFDVVLRFSF